MLGDGHDLRRGVARLAHTVERSTPSRPSTRAARIDRSPRPGRAADAPIPRLARTPARSAETHARPSGAGRYRTRTNAET
jgi:hypothetical protein